MLLFRHLPKLLTRLVRLSLFSFQRSNFVFRCRFDNYLIISAVWLEVNNFFRNLFFIFASCCCVSLTTSIYYHRFKKTSTVFLYFFQFILNIFFSKTHSFSGYIIEETHQTVVLTPISLSLNFFLSIPFDSHDEVFYDYLFIIHLSILKSLFS